MFCARIYAHNIAVIYGNSHKTASAMLYLFRCFSLYIPIFLQIKYLLIQKKNTENLSSVFFKINIYFLKLYPPHISCVFVYKHFFQERNRLFKSLVR